MPLDLRFVGLACLLILGFGTQALTGFGGIIITLTLGAHLYPLDALLPLLVPLSLVSTGYIVLRHGARIDARLLLGRILPFMGAGFACGALGFARFGGSPGLKRAYGALVVFIALGEVLGKLRREVERRANGAPANGAPGDGAPANEAPANEAEANEAAVNEAATAANGAPAAAPSRTDPSPGGPSPTDLASGGPATPAPSALARSPWLVLAGLAQGLYASGGPLLVHALAREPIDKGRFRSTLCAVWLLLNATLVGSYAFGGRLTASGLGRSAALLPAVAVAIALGEWGHDRIDERRFRAAIDVLLLIAGAALIAR